VKKSFFSHRLGVFVVVNCVAYQNGRKLADISIDEIHLFVNEPDCFVWVALQDPEAAELEVMQREFALHELAVEDARHGHQRPKVEEYGDSLFAALHMIEAEGEELTAGEVNIFAGPNYVLSVRRRARRGFTDVRARCEREPDLLRHGAGYVLYALMDAVVDRYFPVLDMLETELENIEERMFANQTTRANIEALYQLKHKLMVLKHATEPLIEAMGRLHGGRVVPLCVGLQDYFRDVCDHLVRLNQSIDRQREMLTTAISVNLSLITIQESEVTKRLASYAALVAVPTLIAGVYGMNFQNMPELSWELGYPVTLGVMAVFDAYLFYRFRKANWL
jgi:magnesium transporter